MSVRFETLAYRAGLPPVRFHDLRHGAASLCKAAGLDTKYIAALLGHARSSFTDDVYVTLFPEVAKAAAEAAAAVVPRAGRAAREEPSPGVTLRESTASTRVEEIMAQMAGNITLLSAAASETGRVRQDNEDSAYAGRWLYAVADGMGGHAAGDVASAAVIESLRSRDAEVDPAVLLETLGRAVTEANAEVARRAAEDPARRGMGTTLTAMLWSGDRAALVHIGDSRAFRLRGGQLRQITEDHVMGNLVFGAEAVLAPVLSRYLDGQPERSPDLGLRELRAGDRYLICSDGLSPVVSTGDVRSALVSAEDPPDAVRQLVALAEDAGAPDNITVIVIDVRMASAEAGHAGPVTLGAAAPVLAR